MRSSRRAAWGVVLCAAALSGGCGNAHRVPGGVEEPDSNGAGGTTGDPWADGSDAGAASEGLVPLVPLIAGHESQFELMAINPAMPTLGACDTPTAKVEGPTTIGGFNGVLYRSPCAPQPYLVQGSGDRLRVMLVQEDGTLQMPAFDYIHSPVQEGESWVVDGIQRTWKAIDEAVTTPAGTFDACWEIQAGSDLSLSYCRGVGLVRLVNRTNNTDLELSHKNF